MQLKRKRSDGQDLASCFFLDTLKLPLLRYFKARETSDDPADVTADIAARAQALSDRLASRLPPENPPTNSGGADGELPSSSYSPSKQGDETPAEEGGGEMRKRWHVPKRLRVRALALVNIRKSPGVQELDAMMRGGTQARWGNEMGYVMLPLLVDQVRFCRLKVRVKFDTVHCCRLTIF